MDISRFYNHKNRINKNKASILLLLFLLICDIHLCVAGENKMNDSMVIRLEAKIPEMMKKAIIPGLSIAVIKNGELYWNKEFGVKNAITGSQVTADTLFEAASTGKSVFAYAVMRLVEKGIIDTDTPLLFYTPMSHLEKIWPGYNCGDNRMNQITTRMVLTHSTGFPNWPGKVQEILFNPGERFSYSGSGFVYLGETIKKLTGLPLDEFVNEEVLKPLGMTNSFFVWNEKVEECAASKHDAAGNATPGTRYREPLAAGSLYTTATDYASFLLAVINETGLKKKTWNEVLTPFIQVTQKDKCIDDIYWGLGFGLHKTDDEYSIWHHGDNGNCKAYFEISKKRKEGFVYFANGVNGLSIADELAKIILNQRSSALSKFADYPSYDSPEINSAKAKSAP